MILGGQLGYVCTKKKKKKTEYNIFLPAERLMPVELHYFYKILKLVIHVVNHVLHLCGASTNLKSTRFYSHSILLPLHTYYHPPASQFSPVSCLPTCSGDRLPPSRRPLVSSSLDKAPGRIPRLLQRYMLGILTITPTFPSNSTQLFFFPARNSRHKASYRGQ